MTTPLRTFSLAAFTVLFGTHAYADTADTAHDAQITADVRCVMVGLGMGNVHGATPQTAGIMLAFYYLGRLDSHVPKLDLENLIAEQAAKWTQADMRAEALRCGSELTERGKELQTIGQHLVERGRQQELEPQQRTQ